MNVATPDTKITPARVPTLKKRSDFLRLRSGKFCHTPHFILQCQTQPAESVSTGNRVGYTVTTKVGNAVVRNRIKRRLRMATSKVFPQKAKPGNDYVLIAKHPTLASDFDAICTDLSRALDRVHTNRANGENRKRKSK